MMRTVVHLGYPKAASSSLQVNFFSRHPDINYMGIFPLKNRGATDTQSIASMARAKGDLALRIHQILALPDGNPEEGALLSGAHKEVQSYLGSDAESSSSSSTRRVNVYSDESTLSMFGPAFPARLRRLRAIFGDVKPVVVLREQMSLLRSKYRDRPGDPRREGRGPAMSPDEWVEVLLSRNAAGQLLQYPAVLDRVAREMGEEPTVLLFEDLVSHWARSLGTLSGDLGVKWSPELAKTFTSTRENRGVSRAYQIARSWGHRMGMERPLKRLKETPFGRSATRLLLLGPTQHVVFSHATEELVASVCLESNRRLEKRLGHELKSRGYLV